MHGKSICDMHFGIFKDLGFPLEFFKVLAIEYSSLFANKKNDLNRTELTFFMESQILSGEHGTVSLTLL